VPRCYMQVEEEVTALVSEQRLGDTALVMVGPTAMWPLDASQCPLSTDLVFWPNSRSIPSMPPRISVCFVGKSIVQQ
jgi:hypothetical protein